jgi:hypothetical protein
LITVSPSSWKYGWLSLLMGRGLRRISSCEGYRTIYDNRL